MTTFPSRNLSASTRAKVRFCSTVSQVCSTAWFGCSCKLWTSREDGPKKFRQKILRAASLPMMPVPVDPQDPLAEILREILALTRPEGTGAEEKPDQSDPNSRPEREHPKPGT